MMNQGNKIWIKTDDRIDFSSKYGQKISKNFYFAGLLNFRTQWYEGYNLEDLNTKISDFMSPGYLLGAVGLEYRKNQAFTFFLAPLTSKTLLF
jgi:hypothetical protein